MNLNKSLKVMEYIHATLHFAVLLPLVYAVADLSDPAGTGVFYLKCLVIAASVVLTDFAVKRTRNFFTYFLCCALLFAGLAGGMRIFFYDSAAAGKLALAQRCYFGGILVETLLLAGMRFYNRVKEAAREREDPLAGSEPGMLNSPALSHVWYFVVFYLLGLCTDSKMLCDITFGSTMVYTFESAVILGRNR